MGYWKQQQIKDEGNRARGYEIPERGNKYLCLSHLRNKYLTNLLKQHVVKHKCSYCGKQSDVIDLADFIECVCLRLTKYVGPIDDENLYLASSFLDNDKDKVPGWIRRGPYVAPDNVEYYESADEVMADFDLCSDNENLNIDIEHCLYVNGWIRRDPTGLLMKDHMKFSWEAFSELVKGKIRYTFFRSAEYYKDIDNTYVGNDIVADISSMAGILAKKLPIGTKIYRGRPEDDKGPYLAFKDLTAPPKEYAKNNRMTPQGISVFYGSLEQNTPISEIQNYLPDKTTKIYLGEFVTTKELNIIDLCNIPIPDFWMGENGDWQKYAFLRDFHKEISKPINPHDAPIDYIPTQIFSEYLRFIQKTDSGKPYDGIIYRSSLTGEENIVLFYDDISSANILSLNRICTKKGIS